MKVKKKVKKEDLVILTGWADEKLCITIYDAIKEEKIDREIFSIKDLCDEPATGWHNHNKESDQYHYDMVKKIAKELREQADRLDSVIETLTVTERNY